MSKYRYAHKSNNVAFAVDFREGAYSQRCHDFRVSLGSARFPAPPGGAGDLKAVALFDETVSNRKNWGGTQIGDRSRGVEHAERGPIEDWVPPRIESDDDEMDDALREAVDEVGVSGGKESERGVGAAEDRATTRSGTRRRRRASRGEFLKYNSTATDVVALVGPVPVLSRTRRHLVRVDKPRGRLVVVVVVVADVSPLVESRLDVAQPDTSYAQPRGRARSVLALWLLPRVLHRRASSRHIHACAVSRRTPGTRSGISSASSLHERAVRALLEHGREVPRLRGRAEILRAFVASCRRWSSARVRATAGCPGVAAERGDSETVGVYSGALRNERYGVAAEEAAREEPGGLGREHVRRSLGPRARPTRSSARATARRCTEGTSRPPSSPLSQPRSSALVPRSARAAGQASNHRIGVYDAGPGVRRRVARRRPEHVRDHLAERRREVPPRPPRRREGSPAARELRPATCSGSIARRESRRTARPGRPATTRPRRRRLRKRLRTHNTPPFFFGAFRFVFGTLRTPLRETSSGPSSRSGACCVVPRGVSDARRVPR